MAEKLSPATNPEADETASLHGSLVIVAALVTFLALCALTLLLPGNPYVRYQQLGSTIHFRTVWAYERIVFDKTPIDVALIGNSRLGAGVSGPELSQGLASRLGRPVHVVNFSMPQDGRNTHYVLTKLLLAHHSEVKLILVDIIEQSARKGHPAFRNLADTNDVLTAPALINFGYVDDLGYLPYRQMLTFAGTRYPALFGFRTSVDPAQYLGPDMETTTSFTQVTGARIDRDTIHSRDEIEAGAAPIRNGQTPPVLPRFLHDEEFVMPELYMDKIAALAKAKRTNIAFLYLPVFGAEPVAADWKFYEKYGPVLDARFLRTDHRQYSDGAHLNRIGAQRVDAWLAAELLKAPQLLEKRGAP
ncbi:hypothetical protein [Novosphingobium jiangmenense]|uniref:SGNH/GDSL hydrolase family protein n=1 Tax=Novosphingobium jiangmenense TaxID=2791981 RepID=A0ABS0HLA9_9SPHN|nr:hypothetical protein [Novosphingobium jiangmenense]MBF9153041.1 hypothetical protein [Novosphingobium jiangmenense]